MGLIRGGGEVLGTATQVFAALGENPGVQRVTGATPQQVSNWRQARRFPPERFLQFDDALKRRRLKADPALWRMHKPLGGK
jgi:hypothetical protein